MTEINQKFGKNYKLCSEKKIATLFKTGNRFFKYPYSFTYSLKERIGITPFQVVIAVPKRNFKKAVDRNRIKRQIKEALRKNKLHLETFLHEKNKELALFILYSNKTELTSAELNAKTINGLNNLLETLQNEYHTTND